MLTIFAVPKPFVGHIGTIQRNAILSWTRLRPHVEVLLFGDEPGVAGAAAAFEVEHHPHVARNEFGTPLLNSIFPEAERRGQHGVLCYVNADIVLGSDIVGATRSVSEGLGRFLMVGRTRDLEVTEEFSLDEIEPQGVLWRRAATRGTPRHEWAMDYFVFPRGTFHGMPPFAVGRPAWDNWMIYRARALGLPVVNASEAVLAIHQRHDYAHIKGATGRMWEGPEADRNYELLGCRERQSFSLYDATHALNSTGIVPVRATFTRRVRWILLLTPALAPLYGPAERMARRLRRPLGLVRRGTQST